MGSNEEFNKALNEWSNKWTSKRVKKVCKPCWELHYCPYGPLVEDFPLLPLTQEEALEHNNFLKIQLEKGVYNKNRRKKREIVQEVNDFDINDYPKKHPKKESEQFCSIFGHLCPVFLVSEPFTETNKIREVSRYIPREVMLKVVRRDDSTCQICGKHLLDSQIQFDHKIPVSKGGPSTESNIQVTCLECNLDKSNTKINYR